METELAGLALTGPAVMLAGLAPGTAKLEMGRAVAIAGEAVPLEVGDALAVVARMAVLALAVCILVAVQLVAVAPVACGGYTSSCAGEEEQH